MMPSASVFAAAIGVVLMFGRNVMGLGRGLIRRVWPRPAPEMTATKGPCRTLLCILVDGGWFGNVAGHLDLTISRRDGVWGPLLRAPLYRIATLLLAVGASRWTSRLLVNDSPSFERLVRVPLAIQRGEPGRALRRR